MSKAAAVTTYNTRTDDPVSYVDTRRLSPAARILCWRGMKRLDPERAEMLERDAFIAALRERFGDKVHLELTLDDYRRFVKAGEEAEPDATT